MVHKEHSGGKKPRSKGRPFTSEYNPRKSKRNILDAAKSESSDQGGIITEIPKSAGLESLKDGFDQIEQKQKECLKDFINPNLKETKAVESILTSHGAGGEYLDPIKKEDKKEGEIIDTIEFKNGSNILKIVFKKQHNRSFRIQAFLNETTEIRPVTYTGSSTASSFWNLLKASLKKE